MVRGSPCMCMRHTAQPLEIAASSAPGARKAYTSLMSPAPAAAAARMTSGLLVSIEMTADVAARTRSITGITRRSSSAALTGAAPGRVDSPPTSMKAAPSPAMRKAWRTAVAVSKNSPPSENESGVTLSTPMTTGRLRSTVLSLHLSNGWTYRVPRNACLRREACANNGDSVLPGRYRSARWLTRLRRRLAREGVIPSRRGLGRAAGHEILQLLLVDGLIFHESLGHRVQLLERGREDLARALVVGLDDPPHLLVDGVRGDIRNLLVLRDAAPEEYLAGFLRVGERSELVRQAPLRDHVARQLGGALDVVGGAGGHLLGAEDQLLGDAAAEERRNGALEAALGEAVAILLGQELGDAERATARNDRHLVDRVVLRHRHADDGVARLVVGGHLLLGLAHHHRAPLGAHHDLVLGLLEFVHANDALVGARGEERRLVDEIGQVCAGESRGAARNERRFHIVGEWYAAHVHAQDLLAAAHVRQRHHHLSIETAWPQQCRIEHVGAVGGGDDDDPFIALEAVHLDQQLIERLLALVMAAAEARAAMPADGIDLVDEDDAGGMLLRLLEHVTHARCAHTNEHLDEIRARDREEGHLGLAGDGARQQRLAGAGRADHEDALGNLAAELLEFARVLEEVDDLADLLLRLIDTGDVGERDAHLVFAEEPRAALAEGHGSPPTGSTLHLSQHVHEHHDQQQRRRELQEQLPHVVRGLGRLALDLHVGLHERADESGIVGLGVVGLELPLVLELPENHVALDGHRLDTVVLHIVEEGRVGDLLRLARGRHVAAEHQQQHDHDHYPKQDVLCQVVQRLPSFRWGLPPSPEPTFRTYTKRNCMASR